MFRLATLCFEQPNLKLFLRGTVLGSLMRYGTAVWLIWIDAYTNIHIFESSPSKNLHGMVVRMFMTHTFPTIPQLLQSQLIYVGLHSVELVEMDFVKQHNIQQ